MSNKAISRSELTRYFCSDPKTSFASEKYSLASSAWFRTFMRRWKQRADHPVFATPEDTAFYLRASILDAYQAAHPHAPTLAFGVAFCVDKTDRIVYGRCWILLEDLCMRYIDPTTVELVDKLPGPACLVIA